MGEDGVHGELRRLEESLWVAKTRYDRSLMDVLFADDFFEFGRSGARYSRRECLAAPPAAAIDVTIPLPDFSVHPLDTSNCLVTYTSEHFGNKPGRALRASLWTKTNVGWKLRFHQGTPIP
jgi:hypothetical protein